MHSQDILKILRQYSKLLSQACHANSQHSEDETPLLHAAHMQPLSPSPATYPRNLMWFEHLAKPFTGLDEFGSSRITELLRLHAACDKSCPALPCEQAYQLAKSLPHFDRDLTAYYCLALPAHAREYDLHVAHSIMRLNNPPTLQALHESLGNWHQQGLIHVFSVAALNMPDLADWFPGDYCAKTNEEAKSLLYTLEAFQRAPQDYASHLESFIATQKPASPISQHIATTLDRLAILMSVKSNATTPEEHDLQQALDAFPSEEMLLEPHDAWARLKPALERSLPPSILRVDPAYERKRVKQANIKGTW